MTGAPGETTTYETLQGPYGKLIDVYWANRCGDAAAPLPTVLLWHGRGPDERDVLGPLARAAAEQGLLVFVPDWRSDAPDGGRAHLLGSLEFARREAAAYGGDGDRITVAGWSAGASAAVGTALRPDAVGGRRPAAVLGIAGRYDLPARTTGSVLLDDLATADVSTGSTAVPVPVHLIHGTKDTAVDVQHSVDFRTAALRLGRPVDLTTPKTDHAGVIMTTYDPARNRCVPTTDASVLRAGATTVRILVRAAHAAHTTHAAPSPLPAADEPTAGR
ncbi:carboxylesterase family protein [Streptomyces sp. MST-110588]|uniref:alpha/beta hydrolase n=1 Tax=Streptomyces sp. MST-110588 TaxID=2833628 RepID=UPI001F5D0E72|nr:carboxylesterase family protein [Streptomyces sp. MST-110588]UNO43476.1 carboxylesterase family protein [Streptomyces sp. MST-110588]